MRENDGLISAELNHLGQMAETIAAVFWLADAKEPRILYVSPAYDYIWGRDCQRLYTHYHEFFETIHPDDRERVRSATSNCVVEEQFEIEYRIVRPDGEVRWVRDRGFLMRDQQGAPDRIAGFAEDVSERKRVEDERQRTDQALSESEAKYRTLFESIDEGFCVVEVLVDPNNTPVDYRILEINPIFEQHTGIQQAVGKTARQLNLEAHWIEIYGRVALTGEPVRFEIGSEILKRWFDVYACRTGQPEDRKVAIVFKDISERKQAEEQQAFLLKLSDALRPLTDASEIQATAARILGETLGATRVIYVEVISEGKEVFVHCSYTNGVAELSGRYRLEDYRRNLRIDHQVGRTQVVTNIPNDPHYTPAEKTRYREIEIAAHIDVPLLKNNQFVALLAVQQSTPRQWTENEINLAEETAERTWAAVERARVEADVAADLRDTQLLRELGARPVTEGDIQTLYQEIVSAAIALTRADAGTVQMLDNATQELVALASQGFECNVVEHFYRVNACSNTSCGIALRTNDRVFLDFDVPESEDPDGSLRMHVEAGYLSAQSTPLITRSGTPIRMVSTHWREHRRPSDRELRFLDLLARQAADLIEQRQTVAEREQLLAHAQTARAEADAARAEAERANRIKDEFLAVLSHELRSPLNPILGWAKLLQQGKLDAAKTQQAIQTIERNAQLQSELIEDLLDVSRILRGKLSLTVNKVNLGTVIRAAMETVRLAAEAKGIEVRSESPETSSPLQIMGDATRLQQVVQLVAGFV